MEHLNLIDMGSICNQTRILDLKQRLEYHLKYFLSVPDKVNHSIFFSLLEVLKKRYTKNESINFILKIQNYLSSVNKNVDEFITNLSIENLTITTWNDESLMKEILKHIEFIAVE